MSLNENDIQEELRTALSNRDIDQFKSALDRGANPNLLYDNQNSFYEKALYTPGSRQFIEACINHDCSVNYVNEKWNKAAVHYATESMDPENLKELLKDRPDETVYVDQKYYQITPLNWLAKNLTEENASAVVQCMLMLLKKGASFNTTEYKTLDIDSDCGREVPELLQGKFPEFHLPKEHQETEAKIDQPSRSFRDEDENLKALKHGAYIGSTSKNGNFLIKQIPIVELKKHFDSCITTVGSDPEASNYMIKIDFKTLKPPEDKPFEMAPIAILAESKELVYLLQHPLISGFLFLKWRRVSFFFYVNFIFFGLLGLINILHIVLKFHEIRSIALIIILLVCTSCLFFRMIINLYILGYRYFCSAVSIMECAVMVLSFTICISFEDKQTERVLASLSILAVSANFCIMIGFVPALGISTYMLMLREVSFSFLKSISAYSIFLLAFSGCFYILFNEPLKKPDVGGTTEQKNQTFDFTNFYIAFIKTTVMMTGEFNAGELEFTGIFTYLFFLLFIMSMNIMLLNLLNGLAVSDTQEIKNRAELNGAICMFNLLSRCEMILTSPGRFNTHLRSINIFPNYLKSSYIYVLPNQEKGQFFVKWIDGR
ncbi:transient receptor potential cation channel protein painless-like isoform X2 [Drosophila eugracilis]|uniref:transient receptor potential cation channel protein painless-like isoform X2 n=1 Tax=Drosophila eugracilis TaxID=29029 RepID=UPI0007E69F13|nr:transient receptor potential cation channel protein painless-like isoform X2 [Drosophila eugracilis]